MISSCAECKTPCCRSGPGPWKIVSKTDWLSQKQQGSKRYNTQCENLTVDNKCKVWETELPVVCATHVCGVRTYTEAELKNIDNILEEFEKYKNNNGK